MQPLATRTCTERARALARALVLCAAWTCAPALAIEWQVDITPAGELFPALQLSQAPNPDATAIGAGDGLVSVRIRPCAGDTPACAAAPSRVQLRIETPLLRAPTVLDATRVANTALVLHPRLEWDIGALRALHAPRLQVMRISLDGETREIEVRVHPLDDALYFVREGRDRVDLGWAFAGYVDPDDAVVDDVLAHARQLDADLFAEHRTIDAATTLRRVGAVWAALEQRGLRYAGGNPALSQGPAIYSQRVRLLGEIWRERRANCIDSSVLIASVLERLGIRVFIVLVPGHAFVRFDTDRDARYLETTLLGARGGREADADASRLAAAHFAAALAAGRTHWRKIASRFDGRHGPDYALIDIETARAYGIIPLSADAQTLRRSWIRASNGRREAR